MTLSQLVLATIAMDSNEALHAPRYNKYLHRFATSFHLNLGIRSCDRKTDQKIRIVLDQVDGPMTRWRPIELLSDEPSLRAVSGTRKPQSLEPANPNPWNP